MREQIEDRIPFTKEEKEAILEKTDGKCAHCGCALSKDSDYDMTVDHVIPLSKGGTNDLENLVGLCYECNQKKGNMVVLPVDYYYYMKKEKGDELMRMYRQWCKDVSWFNTRNYTKEDAYLMNYEQPIPFLTGKLPKKKAKTSKNYGYGTILNQTAILRKATADDLEKLIEYNQKYRKKFQLSESQEEVTEWVMGSYKKGCVYFLEKNNEIIAVFPIMIGKKNLKDDEPSPFYTFQMSPITTLYQHRYYRKVIATCVFYITYNLSFLNEYRYVSLYFDVSSKDEYIRDIIEMILEGSLMDENETICSYRMLRQVPDEIMAKNDPDYEEETEIDDEKEEKFLLTVSSGIERRMNLKTIKQFKQEAEARDASRKKFIKSENDCDDLAREKLKKRQKERKRHSQIDEYDLKYYGFS